MTTPARPLRFGLAGTGHAAIDGIAVQDRAALSGDGPGDIGLGGGFGDAQGILGGAAAARPHRDDEKQCNHRYPHQQRIACKAGGLRCGNGQAGSSQGQQKEGQGGPAPRPGGHTQSHG